MNEQPNIDAIVQLFSIPGSGVTPGAHEQLATVIMRSLDRSRFTVRVITGRAAGLEYDLRTDDACYEVQIP